MQWKPRLSPQAPPFKPAVDAIPLRSFKRHLLQISTINDKKSASLGLNRKKDSTMSPKVCQFKQVMMILLLVGLTISRLIIRGSPEWQSTPHLQKPELNRSPRPTYHRHSSAFEQLSQRKKPPPLNTLPQPPWPNNPKVKHDHRQYPLFRRALYYFTWTTPIPPLLSCRALHPKKRSRHKIRMPAITRNIRRADPTVLSKMDAERARLQKERQAAAKELQRQMDAKKEKRQAEKKQRDVERKQEEDLQKKLDDEQRRQDEIAMEARIKETAESATVSPPPAQ